MPTPVGYVTDIASYRQSIKDFGTAVSFNGSSGIVTLGTTNPFTGSFYFSAWINWKGLNGGFQTIFAKRDSYAVDGLMFSMSLVDTTGLLAFDTVTSYVAFNYRFPVGKPTHMTWVHDTVNAKDYLYINGILTSTQNIATLGTKTNAVISIGGTQSPVVDVFNGEIDEVCIGTVAPTYEEVIKMYAKYIYPSQWSYLKFDEGTGSTATDSSGNGNNGTITSASYVPSKVMRVRQASGIDLGNCINFNTSTSRITFTIPSTWDLSSYSMGFWIYPTTLNSSATTTRLIDCAPSGNGFLVIVNAGGITAAVKHATTDAQMTSGADTIALNKWQRVLITWSNSDNTPHIYINGIQTDGTAQNKSGAINTPFPTGSTGYLGNRTGNDRAFAGLMDEFCFWSGVLTPEQIRQDYVSPQSVTDNLITRYKMDEMTGTFADSIGSVTATPASTTQGVISLKSDRFLIRSMGKSLQLNGTTDFATIPIVPDTNGFSFSLWLKSFYTSGNKVILSCESATNTDGFKLSMGTSIFFSIFNGATTPAQPGFVFTGLRGRWIHICGTFAPNNASIYLNGVLQNYDTSCVMSAPSTFQLGKSLNFGTTCFPANIAEFIFHNTSTPWTQQQINDLYYKGILPSGALRYSFNNNATDQNGANGLTLTGTTYSTDVPLIVRTAV